MITFSSKFNFIFFIFTIFAIGCKSNSDCYIPVNYKGNSKIRANIHPRFSIGISQDGKYLMIQPIKVRNSIFLIQPTDKIIRIDGCMAPEIFDIDYAYSPSDLISKPELVATLEKSELVGKIKEIELIRNGKKIIIVVE